MLDSNYKEDAIRLFACRIIWMANSALHIGVANEEGFELPLLCFFPGNELLLASNRSSKEPLAPMPSESFFSPLRGAGMLCRQPEEGYFSADTTTERSVITSSLRTDFPPNCVHWSAVAFTGCCFPFFERPSILRSTMQLHFVLSLSHSLSLFLDYAAKMPLPSQCE